MPNCCGRSSANAELRTKTYEALATATTQAVHWIGNKALPITTTIARIKKDLGREPLDIASIREDLDLIDESARLIVDVKENLLGPAREQRPRPAMLEDVVQAAAYHAGLQPTQLALNVASDTPMILADTTQLARALGNLFRNSQEAAAAHVAVTIAPAEEKGFVSLDITDDGEGIPAEMMDKIWAAFVTTKGASHTGLGLPACLHVISQLDGHITAVSEAGHGATFTILLPASAEAGPAAADLEAGPAKTDKRTSHILLIDDEDPWAQFAVNTLSAAGYW
jgi:signal transduction histidine kinase